MPRLIIHPGAPKTGTSTLQHFLHHHRQALARQGVAVLGPHAIRRSRFMRACRQATRGGPAVKPGLLKGFAARYADFDTVLISEEGFTSGFLIGGEAGPQGLERADLSAAVIADLPFDDIRAILTIRQQRGLLVSSYAHRVKLSRERRGFGRWMREAVAADRLSWAGVAAAFESALGEGRLSLLPFEIVKAEGAEAYARAFFAAAGLGAEGVDFSRVPAANVSASHLAVVASRAFNRIALSGAGRSTLNARLTRRFPSDRFGGFRPKDPALTAVAAAYAEENAALARRWFPDHAAAFLGGLTAAGPGAMGHS